MSDSKKRRTHPVSDAAISTMWPLFAEKVRSRLLDGADSYGDGSFYKEMDALCDDVEQEILDQMGWTFIQYCRLQETREKIRQIEQRLEGYDS